MMSQQDGEAARSDLVTGVTTLEKAAQGGHGFQTVGLDLGVLGSRTNVDEEMRRTTLQKTSDGNVVTSGGTGSSFSGGATGGSRSSSTYESHHSSSGSRQGGHTYSTQDAAHYGNSAENHAGDDYGPDESYDENYDEQSGTQGGSYQGSQGRTYSQVYTHRGPLNANHESIDQKFKHYPVKRDVSGSEPLCKSTRCVNVRCVVGPLDKNTGALIALRTRLVAHTLHKVSEILIKNFRLRRTRWIF